MLAGVEASVVTHTVQRVGVTNGTEEGWSPFWSYQRKISRRGTSEPNKLIKISQNTQLHVRISVFFFFFKDLNCFYF